MAIDRGEQYLDADGLNYFWQEAKKLIPEGIETEITGNTNFFKLYGIDSSNDSVSLKSGVSWAFGSISVSKTDTLDNVVTKLEAAADSTVSNIYFDSHGVLHFTNEDLGSMTSNEFTSLDGSVTYTASEDRLSNIPKPMSDYPADVNNFLQGLPVSNTFAYADFDTLKKISDEADVTHDIYTGEENFAQLYGIDINTTPKVYFVGNAVQISWTVNVQATVGFIEQNNAWNFSKATGRFYTQNTKNTGVITEIAHVYADVAHTQELFPSYDRVYAPSKLLDAGDGISIEDGTISVETPVKSILTQEEFDALTDDEKNHGMYVISNGESSGGGSSGGSGIPTGGIIIWTGTEVPDGWALCDGTNGTPDLRGRFVLGESTDHEIGETGGSEEVTLTFEQMPDHRHTIAVIGISTTEQTSSSYKSIKAGGSQTGNTNLSGNSKPHPNMPPYYVLAYIMKL